jgi:hypothetical protein
MNYKAVAKIIILFKKKSRVFMNLNFFGISSIFGRICGFRPVELRPLAFTSEKGFVEIL